MRRPARSLIAGTAAVSLTASALAALAVPAAAAPASLPSRTTVLADARAAAPAWFTTCLSASRTVDLTSSGCLLTKP